MPLHGTHVHEQLAAQNVPHKWYIDAGAHTFPVWKNDLYELLAAAVPLTPQRRARWAADQENYRRPITGHRSWRREPDLMILEYDCDRYPFFRGLEIEGTLEQYWQRMRQRQRQ
jgi:hypothetical protein